MVVYLSIVYYCSHAGFLTNTGDEPHYVMIAESIGRDGDLKVLNNYEEHARSRELRDRPPDD